jgi:hypothetical protein
MDLGLARRPPPDPGDGRVAVSWTGGSRAGVATRPPLANFGSKKNGRDYPPSSAPSHRPWSCRSRVSDVATWGSGWEDFWFLFRVKEGGMIRCFAHIYLFWVFFFFLFHVDMSTSYWWAEMHWFLPPSNRSYSL